MATSSFALRSQKGSSLDYLTPTGGGPDLQTEDAEEENQLGLCDLAERLYREEEAPSSPIGGASLDLRLCGKRQILEDSDEEWPFVPPEHDSPARWVDAPLVTSKFIDDINALEKCDITGGRSLLSTKKERRFLHAKKCQEFLETVMENSKAIGMVVNPKKTQLVCTTTAINYEVRSFVIVDGIELTSGDTLKSVGYTFGRRPGPGEHLKRARQKYGARAGTLRHLKKIKFEEKTLVRVYCSLIRPVLEYCSNAFHTSLTQEQSDAMERLQRQSLKVIYGYDTPYSECLERSGIERMSERRDRLFRNFAAKSYESSRFGPKWFTSKAPSSYQLRHQPRVVQEFANCDRLANAPIFRMRKIINEL